ncbi:MAG: sensor histidine kinase [Culicoidibacterales bacterium]
MKWQSLQMKLTLLVIAVVIIVTASTAVLINLNVATLLPTAAQGIVEEYVDENGVIYGSIQTEVTANGFVTAIPETGVVVSSTLQMIQGTSLLFVFVIVMIAIAVSYWLIGRFLRSFQQLHTQLQTRDHQALLVPLTVASPHLEVQEMTQAVNHLLAKISHLFGEQQRLNASLAHELKTPLAVMQTKIDVMRLSAHPDINEYATLVTELGQKIQQMNQSIEALLDLSQGEQAVLDDVVDLNQIIEAVIDDYQGLAFEKKIKLIDECQSVKTIIGNEILLYRCLANICENAIKYTNPGGQVSLRCREVGTMIEITVQDTGIGMDAQAQAHMFEPFYRVNQTAGGLGLGLALVANVIRLHNGEIHVSSELEQGTTITIIF